MSAHIEIDERQGVWVLRASGELDYADCETLRFHVDRVLAEMPPACIVDLSKIDYLDSSALGLLLRLDREYAGAGGRLVLVASSVVDGVLQITRLDDMFVTSHNLDSALESVGSA